MVPTTERPPGRFRLFRLAGLEIEGHVALLPLLVLLGFVLATNLLPAQEKEAYGPAGYAVLGALGALLLLVSVLAHELAHALTARAHGVRVERVPVFFHAARAEDGDEPETPLSELLVAAVGPATSIALGGLAWAATTLTPEMRFATPLLRFATVANLLLGLASLLPAFPLDGGRLVRAVFWAASGTKLQGTRIACAVSKGLAAMLVGVALVQLASVGFGALAGWGFALGLLLWLQATATWRLTQVREGLRDLVVSDLMSPVPTALPRQVSVQDALFDPSFDAMRQGGRAFLVDFHGRLGGVVTLGELRRVPEVERASTPVWEVTQRLRREHLVGPLTRAEVALRRFMVARLPLLPVVHDGHFVGVLSRQALQGAIESAAAGRPLTSGSN